MNRDSILFVLYALATSVVSVLVGHGTLSASDAVEISTVLTAAATAYHIPNAKASAAIKDAKQAEAALSVQNYLDAS